MKHNFARGWGGRFKDMVFNPLFNNISVVSWQSVFIGGGNRIKPQTCRMIILSCGPMLKGIIFLKKHTRGYFT